MVGEAAVKEVKSWIVASRRRAGGAGCRLLGAFAIFNAGEDIADEAKAKGQAGVKRVRQQRPSSARPIKSD